MRLRNYRIFGLLLFVFFSLQSCKKNDESPINPIPVVKPDTLTTGWTKKTFVGEYELHDIFFSSPTTGYLTTSRLYKTIDGGNSWNVVLPNTFLFKISVTLDNKAFFLAQSNLIYKTIDGGLNFSNTNISTPLVDIFFVDNANGYCTALDGLYHTNDGGINWAKINTSGLPTNVGNNFKSIFCINNSTGWIAASDGIYRSSGSMTNWQLASTSGGIPFVFSSIYAPSANIIYAANYNGEIFKSIDGGLNFSFSKKLEMDGPGGLEDIHFINSLLGYASIGRYIYKTSDGALTWTKVVSIGEGILGEMHFTDASHGWVIGDSRPGIESFVLTFK